MLHRAQVEASFSQDEDSSATVAYLRSSAIWSWYGEANADHVQGKLLPNFCPFGVSNPLRLLVAAAWLVTIHRRACRISQHYRRQPDILLLKVIRTHQCRSCSSTSARSTSRLASASLLNVTACAYGRLLVFLRRNTSAHSVAMATSSRLTGRLNSGRNQV